MTNPKEKEPIKIDGSESQSLHGSLATEEASDSAFVHASGATNERPAIGPLLPDGAFISPPFIGPLPASDHTDERETRPRLGPLMKDGTFISNLGGMAKLPTSLYEQETLEWERAPLKSERTAGLVLEEVDLGDREQSRRKKNVHPMPSKKDLRDSGMPTEFASHGKVRSSPRKSVHPMPSKKELRDSGMSTEFASHGKEHSSPRKSKEDEKQGYQPGSGLGKNEDGIKEPIQPEKRKKKQGLGYL